MTSTTHPRLISGWLLFCALMIFTMSIIGATTRLTESGLSITEWKPVMGAWPPDSPTAWQQEFDLYKKTPEYQKKNMGMTLGEFKHIYFWEWLHRLWGRLIGVVFLFPFIIFWFSGTLSARLTWKLYALLALGGAQGFIGWFMVQSGLIDRPSVSHYRLALHLGCALLLYTSLIWMALSVKKEDNLALNPIRGTSRCLRAHGVLSLFCIALTLVWGAFVAGLDAGLIYNEFPTMGDGHLVPKEMWYMTPSWINLFENHAAVQFTHRWLAIGSIIVLLSLVTHALLIDLSTRLFVVLAVMSLLQAGLGILTLISNVNLYAGIMHQGGALFLLGLLTAGVHAAFSAPIDKRR